MNRPLRYATFLIGLAALAWVATSYVGANPLALIVTGLIGAFYFVGALELRRFHRATSACRTGIARPARPSNDGRGRGR